LPQIRVQSPVKTTVAWFKAVNDQNAPLALAHFAAAERDQMEWSQWGPPFQHLRCNLQSGTSSSAIVYCSFSPITDASTGMSGDASWDVYLQREASGRWLINNCGQG
jgi:hypothetical protein